MKVKSHTFIWICSAVLLGALLLTACASHKRQKALETEMDKYRLRHSSSVFTVTYRCDIGPDPVIDAAEEIGCEVIYEYQNFCGIAIKRPRRRSLDETMRYFQKVEGVISVSYDEFLQPH